MHQLDPAIQVNWFTAACRAVKRSDLNGIYFWMLDSSGPQAGRRQDRRACRFIGQPGEKAIERCFAEAP